MTTRKKFPLSKSVLLLGTTGAMPAWASGTSPKLLLAAQALSGLAGPTLWLAVPAMGSCIFGGWVAAASILKRRYANLSRRVETRLVQEIKLLDSAIDKHSIVSITNCDGVIINVNENFEAAFGYSSEEILGKSTSALYGDSPDVEKTSIDSCAGQIYTTFSDVHLAVKSGLVWSGEQKLRRANGEVIHVMSTILPHFDDEGNHIQNVSLRTDITQQRANESQRQLTLLLDELQDEVFLYDVASLNISYMNKSALARCEWTAEELAGKTIADTSTGFSVPDFRAHVAPLMDGSRKVVSVETRHEKGPVEISTRIYVGPSGTEVFLSVLRDTSERKKLQMAKMDTMATVSHELRTPLTSIKGALRLIQSGVAGELSPKIKGMIDIASRNSDRLLLMVNDILTLEKMNSNKDEFVMEETYLATILQDAILINKGFGDELGVNFINDPLPCQCRVSGNSTRLMQVMTNLMSNAAKFSPKCGSVHVGVTDQGQNWRVYVKDNGPGIPETARATIFDSFTQFSAADGTTRPGSGLGLQISKQIISRHNGKISYESEPGIETNFYFDIPKLTKSPKLSVIGANETKGLKESSQVQEEASASGIG